LDCDVAAASRACDNSPRLTLLALTCRVGRAWIGETSLPVSLRIDSTRIEDVPLVAMAATLLTSVGTTVVDVSTAAVAQAVVSDPLLPPPHATSTPAAAQAKPRLHLRPMRKSLQKIILFHHTNGK
jgi:hypothetical protein